MAKKNSKSFEINSEIAEEVGDVIRQMPSQIKQLHLSEATIPDAFRKVPKVVSPGVHRWLDVAVTAYFTGLGIWFAVRGKAGPATAAFINAGMVGAVSAFTDYEGTGEKPIDFKMHGTLDAIQATTAAIAPVLHGFADEGDSAFFYAQSANEVAVIATTDWDAGMPPEARAEAA